MTRRGAPHLDMRGIGLLLAERHSAQRPGVHAQFLQGLDLLQSLGHRARRVTLGQRLEPFEVAALQPGL
jgi:hypothetical protein